MAKTKNKTSPLWTAAMILCSIVALVSLVMLLIIYWPALGRSVVKEPDHGVESQVEAPVLLDNPIDFAALAAENEDVVGWIRIPGTTIDYPILQSGPEDEEDFYLTHGWDKKRQKAGCIYIQKMNSPHFTDPNTVIGGHYMANGTMFADLHQFRKEAFFNEHDTVYIYTPGHILTYRIYSAFVYDDRHILNSFDFDNKADFAAFLAETLDPASMARRMREGVNVTTDDRIISLCTCTMRDGERYLVEGVLINDQLTK